MSSRTKTLESLRSRPPPNHSTICATDEITPAIPAATEPVRISRL